jgi:hypothetical protein
MISTTTFTPDAVVPAPVNTSPMTTKESTKRRRRKGKAVSFYPQVTIKYCLHFTDYTPQEKSDSWMTAQEHRASRTACNKLAIEFSKPGASSKNGISQNGDCLRGLEGKTAQGLIRRKRIKAVARKAVFDEQNSQINLGVVDVETLANEYYEHTEYAQIDAHMKALRDQVEALIQSPSTAIKGIEIPTTTTTPTSSRKLFFTRRNSASTLLTSTSSRRSLTDKFFKV